MHNQFREYLQNQIKLVRTEHLTRFKLRCLYRCAVLGALHGYSVEAAALFRCLADHNGTVKCYRWLRALGHLVAGESEAALRGLGATGVVAQCFREARQLLEHCCAQIRSFMSDVDALDALQVQKQLHDASHQFARLSCMPILLSDDSKSRATLQSYACLAKTLEFIIKDTIATNCSEPPLKKRRHASRQRPAQDYPAALASLTQHCCDASPVAAFRFKRQFADLHSSAAKFQADTSNLQSCRELLKNLVEMSVGPTSLCMLPASIFGPLRSVYLFIKVGCNDGTLHVFGDLKGLETLNTRTKTIAVAFFRRWHHTQIRMSVGETGYTFPADEWIVPREQGRFQLCFTGEHAQKSTNMQKHKTWHTI